MPDSRSSEFHARCFACGADNSDGLHLTFRREGRKSIGLCRPGDRFRSYDDRVHGGILGTILDAAMVHALRDEGLVDPVTVRLDIRFRHAVAPGSLVIVAASMDRRRANMVWLGASLTSQGVECASAVGIFRVGMPVSAT